jgi:ABC-2 type transport system ATP-binding protein
VDDAILLSDLAKSFGPVQAVRGLDISIARGETVALLGPNGAGKSTTLDMLLGLLPPDRGEVAIFGRAPADAIAEGLVGGMLQSGALIRDLSVRELLMMVAALYPAPLPVAEVLAMTGIGELAERRTQKLSGGESQRVRFAITLVADPELLVLDEPTVAMDVESRRAFWDAMRSFATRGKTVVFATHYLEEADEFADRICVMARGLVVADGPTTEIKARVGSRVIRATLPLVDAGVLRVLPGVSDAQRHGESIVLRCADSDRALRTLLDRFPTARDVEVRGAGLEEAFLALTTDDEPGARADTTEEVG